MKLLFPISTKKVTLIFKLLPRIFFFRKKKKKKDKNGQCALHHSLKVDNQIKLVNGVQTKVDRSMSSLAINKKIIKKT
jgi:hypothetical protein